MAYPLIQIQSYLFIISQPKVSFPFLIFKESSYCGIYFYIPLFSIKSHILRLQMGTTTFNTR